MGLLRGLSMLSLLMSFFWFPHISARPSARALDALLQDYAYQAFVRPRTGIPYDGKVPANLTGIKVSAMRLRSGSLRTKGVPMYKEFQIPTGVVEQPYVKRLVFVYQNLGNWSSFYYRLNGYTYLAPVLGLLAYDAANLKATNLPELNISASKDPILIKFSDVNAAPDGSTTKCVSIDLHNSVSFSNVSSDNVCSTVEQGHFSIVVESIAPSPAPAPFSPTPNVPGPGTRGKGKESNSKVWIIVGSVVGGLALLVLLGFLIAWLMKYKRKQKMRHMERAAEVGEALRMTSVGTTKAPAATVTRTQPTLENEYVP